jgi:hypothetical protein
MEIGSSDFPNARTAMTSPLAKSLFAIDGTFMPLPLSPFAFIFISICAFALVVLNFF